jgi:membrane-associated phospholipid phosphatase
LILLVGATAGLHFGVDPPENARWESSNGFDDSVRSGLRLSSGKARRTAGDISSAFVGGNALLLMSDWVLQREAYPVTESIRTDATWLVSNAFVTRGLKLATGRERPFAADCGAGAATPGFGVCDTDNASFPSGHASLSATFAGLLCARRLHRPDRSLKDVLLCGGASSLAVATGILRISADEHYATDVLAGWASGLVFGYLLPSHFHYGKRASRKQAVRPPSHFITPIVGSELWGLRYDVTF